jgi:hypothetical protein
VRSNAFIDLKRRQRASAQPESPPAVRYNIDDSRWPVVVATVPEDLGSAEQFRAWLDEISALHQRGGMAVVVDLRALRGLSAPYRHALAAAASSDEEKFPCLLRARAWVVGSTEMSLSLSAVSWLAEGQCPQATFGNVDDAVVWCCASFARPSSNTRRSR